MESISTAAWSDIEALRERLASSISTEPSLAAASQSFVSQVVAAFPSISLARVFVVVPFSRLPTAEQDVAMATARGRGVSDQVAATMPVLALLGSAGADPMWNKRELSVGHRAIPLDGAFVRSAPMIASLFSSLAVDLGAFHKESSVELRAMPGGLNTRFFVPDARTAKDDEGRSIIAQDFVNQHGIRTVFGMGGGFVNRTITVAVFFTRELLQASHIDRFASFIGTFKLATSKLVEAGSIFGQNERAT